MYRRPSFIRRFSSSFAVAMWPTKQQQPTATSTSTSHYSISASASSNGGIIDSTSSSSDDLYESHTHEKVYLPAKSIVVTLAMCVTLPFLIGYFGPLLDVTDSSSDDFISSSSKEIGVGVGESVEQKFPIITAYVDAYNKCCSQSNNNHQNCTSRDNKWFTRLMNKHPIVSSGQATLYWAHMRKAGGTSFSRAVESKTFQHTNKSNALFTKGFGHTIKVHLRAGSRDCVDHTYANETLFVTILRNPVDRYVSEYFYSKVEKKLGSNTMRGRTLECYERSKSRSRGEFIKMNKARGDFIENWQTRWYTNPYHCEDLDRPMRMHHGKNYSYWRSGHGKDERMFVSRRDLLHAKIVLDKFDVVAIAPFFGEEAGECSIVPWLRLAGSNKPIAEVNEVRNNYAIKVEERKREKVKQAIWDNLGEHVKLDVELFEFAHELSNRRRAISCCVNEHAMANES